MKERGGGAERHFPQVCGAETIERKGQRVMAVRGRSDGLLQTTPPEARARVWRVFGRGFWASYKGREGEGLCLWPSMHRYFGILDSTLSLGGGLGCQFTAPRAPCAPRKVAGAGKVY